MWAIDEMPLGDMTMCVYECVHAMREWDLPELGETQNLVPRFES